MCVCSFIYYIWLNCNNSPNWKRTETCSHHSRDTDQLVDAMDHIFQKHHLEDIIHRSMCQEQPKLVGGFNPCEKHESQLGLLFPTEWKNKIHLPNHQPEKCRFFMVFLCFFFTSKIGPVFSKTSHQFTSWSGDPTLWSRHGHSKRTEKQPFCWSNPTVLRFLCSCVWWNSSKSSSNPQLTED